ncbi:MAG: hypothetical protein AB1585_04345 [Thermodesulfobacteriota bacterium]
MSMTTAAIGLFNLVRQFFGVDRDRFDRHLKIPGGMVIRQSTMPSYSYIFFILGVIFLPAIPFLHDLQTFGALKGPISQNDRWLCFVGISPQSKNGLRCVLSTGSVVESILDKSGFTY